MGIVALLQPLVTASALLADKRAMYGVFSFTRNEGSRHVSPPKSPVMATWHIRSQIEQFASVMISLFSHFPIMKRCNYWGTGDQGFPFSVNMREDTSAIKQEHVLFVSFVRGNEDR